MKHFLKQHKLVRAAVVLAAILLSLILAVLLFLRLWPAFGGRASREDKEDYAARAENYRDGKFYNDGDFQIMRETERKDDKVISSKGVKPEGEIPTVTPEYGQPLSEEEIRVTWFGHSSMLLQMHGMNILIDPIFSERSSPVAFAGAKRFSTTPVTVEDLPHIDILVLSHDHYDHMDYKTIKKLDEKVDRYIVPLGVENHLERWQVDTGKIRNMAWWEETEINGLTIGCTPVRHYSGRSLDDQFATLWASWVFRDGNHQVYESGDSGYGEQFEQVHDRYGDFDFVLIDCAQYDVTWPEVHMFPEEAVTAVDILGADIAMPIHWGAFSLAYHAWDDSVERFVAAGEETGLQIVTPKIGETVKLNELEDFMERWWRDIP